MPFVQDLTAGKWRPATTRSRERGPGQREEKGEKTDVHLCTANIYIPILQPELVEKLENLIIIKILQN